MTSTDRKKLISWLESRAQCPMPGAARMYRMALDTIREQPNEPLTLEQLREMDGEPVWVVDTKHPEDSGWMQYGYYSAEFYMIAFWTFGSEVESTYSVDNYGKTWLAYRRPPERSEKDG